MQITGAHVVIHSKKPEVDRAFLRDVLGFPHVDAGDGWLIFGLPPSEVAVHPSDKNDVHQFYLLTDDVEGLVAQLAKQKCECEPILQLGWGALTQVTLPGGGKLGIYQPRHPRPPAVLAPARAKTTKVATPETKTPRRRP